MKTNRALPFFAVFMVATATFCGPVEAARVRTYSGGRGYHYRVPSLDAMTSRWHEAPLLPSTRGQRERKGVAPLSAVDLSALSPLRLEFSGKVVMVPRKNAVETVQRSLKGLHYYRGAATGTMNPQFEQALRKFQAESGARNTGMVDAETLDSLGLNAASFAR